MPDAEPRESGKARARNERQSRQRTFSGGKTTGRDAASPAETFDFQSGGGDFSQRTFERNAGLLGNPRLSQPMYARQRATLVQQLQWDYGNQYVQRLVDHISRRKPQVVQTRLAVGPAGDAYEQEADRVAKQVVGGLAASPGQQPVQRQDGEEEELQMKPLAEAQVGVAGGDAGPEVEQAIQRASGQGQPLPDSVRAPMEGAFGADFSGVRVHADGEADALNRSLSARAFTAGQDIFFRQGEYRPGSATGKEVLAHELTHVVQQGGADVQRLPQDQDELPQTTLADEQRPETDAQNYQEMFPLNTAPGLIRGQSRVVLKGSGEAKGQQMTPVETEDEKVSYVAASTPVQNTLTPAGSSGLTTIKLSDVDIQGEVYEDKGKWKIRVTSASTLIDWGINTGGYTIPNPTDGGNITKDNYQDVITELKGYEARQASGAWHHPDASRDHELHHVEWYKSEIIRTWPDIEARIQAHELGSTSSMTKGEAETAMQALLTGEERNWFNAYGLAPEPPAYAVGQAVLDGIIGQIQTYAESKGWVKKSKRCFITTACVEARGLPDDCDELTTLRAFRDGYMTTLPEGAALISEYYEIAPRIVQRMEEQPNSRELFVNLYDWLVLNSVDLIKSGKNQEAMDHYVSIVNELRKEYL